MYTSVSEKILENERIVRVERLTHFNLRYTHWVVDDHRPILHQVCFLTHPVFQLYFIELIVFLADIRFFTISHKLFSVNHIYFACRTFLYISFSDICSTSKIKYVHNVLCIARNIIRLVVIYVMFAEYC